MITPKKVNSVLDYPLQSEAGRTRVTGRDHRSLLRSTGHHFRDGAWDEEDTQFHCYRELENPGLGVLRTFQAGSYYDQFEVLEDTTLRPYSWRPVIGRGNTSSTLYQEYKHDLPDPIEPDYGDYTLGLNAHGTSYIRRFRPGNPVASLAQFIGELHDLPRLPIFLKQRAKHFRDLGSEFLNVEFGWKPFVADLIKVYELQRTIESRLRKLIDGNNIRVKRRSKRELVTPVVSLLAEGSLTPPFGPLGPDEGINVPELAGLELMGPVPFYFFNERMSGRTDFSVYHIVETTTWFVGTFRYYVPDIGSDRWVQQAKDALFGAGGSQSHIAETIYQLYPWSWLVDWFTNVGDLISNLSANAVDQEAITDAYVMQTIVDRIAVSVDVQWDNYEVDVGLPFNTTASIPAGSDKLDYTLLKVQKLRRQASPFGFGLKTEDFTLNQLAILAALGITRGKLPVAWRYFNPKYW